MAKKEFDLNKMNLNSNLEIQKKAPKPFDKGEHELQDKSTKNKERKKKSAAGCKDGYTRQTLVMSEDLIKKLKLRSIEESVSISTIVETLLAPHFEDKLLKITE